MASGLVVHVEVGEERHTEVVTQERVRIGAGADCDLRLRADLLPADTDGPLLELARANGHYRVADFDRSLRLTHNGGPLAAGEAIEDGDRVRLADGRLTLQFFPVSAAPALVPERRAEPLVAAFVERAAVEAAATARRDDAKVFLREFTRELVREINPSTKIVSLAIVLALVGGVLYLGYAGYKELQRSRHQIEFQNQQISALNRQIAESKSQAEQLNESNRDIINSLSLAPKLRTEYGNGVCLISGLYIFVDATTGKPLRYPDPQQLSPTPDAPEAAPAEGAQTQFLTPDGTGAVAEFPYVGTGFHVGQGFVVTNRHVAAEPWTADQRSSLYSSAAVGRPRLAKLLAYFPGNPRPFTLRVKQTSARDDLAVCVLDSQELPASLPVLPLDPGSDATAVGKAVVMMGYPSGPDRILAALSDEQAEGIRQRYGASLDVLVSHLAERNLIKPLTTQGHINALETHRIVYDARTAEGGSGAPLFGQSGKVIGVNFAVFTELSDSNFAVPVRFVLPLLQRAGWQSPVPADAKEGDGAAAAKDARAASAPAAAAPPR